MFRAKFFVLEQTNYCNLCCVTCPNRLNNRPKGFMTPETFKNIVDELLVHIPRIRNKRIVLHGLGEPLLSPHFFTNLDYLEEKGFNWVDFSDNSMLMTEEKAHKLCQYKCIYALRQSLNSSRKDIMEKINTGSNFETVVKNIKNLIKIKKEYPTKSIVFVQLIKSMLNEDETEEEVRRVIGEGYYRVNLKRMNNFSGLVPQNELTFPGEVYNENCVFSRSSILFHWDGDIVGCCDDDTKTQVIGNIKDGLNSEKLERIRTRWESMLINRDFSELPVCKMCFKEKYDKA